MEVRQAVAMACRVRLRPVLMTSLATMIGLLPMALKLGSGSEAYAPLARAIVGGLAVSLAFTVFLVPAAYVLVYDRSKNPCLEPITLSESSRFPWRSPCLAPSPKIRRS
jgi:Cu/Ag efflux pump CusA